jgi:branched-chain amino acid transport system ATP-binding protein
LALALERFPRLRERLDQRAGTLSGGEQQMLAVAPAVAGDYRLLLFDELSLGLAPVIVDELFEVLTGLRAAGTSMVIVEQFAERALELADRAYVLRKGRVAFEGPASRLQGDGDLLHRLYLGGS